MNNDNKNDNFNRFLRETNLNNSTIKKFGLNEDFLSFAKDLKELENKTPNIVIVECLRNFKFIQDGYVEQEMKKKSKYVMNLSIFNKLQVDYYRNKKLLKPSTILFKNLYKKYNGEDLNNKTLLVWRTGGIGDLLFIQPNLKYLKEKYPTCKIIFACGPQYKPMLNNWDCIDELIELPFGFRYLLNSDYHVIFEGVIERCKEAEEVNCYRLFTKWLNLNLDDDKLIPELKPKPELVDKCKNILSNEFNLDYENEKLILCQYRASSKIRTLDPKIFCNLLDKLHEEGYKTIITDLPKQYENIRNFIEKNVKDKNKIFNFSKYSKSIDYTIALASIMNCSISVDSSLIHISQAVGTPVFGIYGPFPGELRLGTYKNCDWIDCKADCSPCFLHGYNPCNNSSKDGYGKCFNNLNINEVVRKVNNLLK